MAITREQLTKGIEERLAQERQKAESSRLGGGGGISEPPKPRLPTIDGRQVSPIYDSEGNIVRYVDPRTGQTVQETVTFKESRFEGVEAGVPTTVTRGPTGTIFEQGARVSRQPTRVAQALSGQVRREVLMERAEAGDAVSRAALESLPSQPRIQGLTASQLRGAIDPRQFSVVSKGEEVQRIVDRRTGRPVYVAENRILTDSKTGRRFTTVRMEAVKGGKTVPEDVVFEVLDTGSGQLIVPREFSDAQRTEVTETLFAKQDIEKKVPKIFREKGAELLQIYAGLEKAFSAIERGPPATKEAKSALSLFLPSEKPLTVAQQATQIKRNLEQARRLFTVTLPQEGRDIQLRSRILARQAERAGFTQEGLTKGFEASLPAISLSTTIATFGLFAPAKSAALRFVQRAFFRGLEAGAIVQAVRDPSALNIGLAALPSAFRAGKLRGIFKPRTRTAPRTSEIKIGQGMPTVTTEVRGKGTLVQVPVGVSRVGELSKRQDIIARLGVERGTPLRQTPTAFDRLLSRAGGFREPRIFGFGIRKAKRIRGDLLFFLPSLMVTARVPKPFTVVARAGSEIGRVDVLRAGAPVSGATTFISRRAERGKAFERETAFFTFRKGGEVRRSRIVSARQTRPSSAFEPPRELEKIVVGAREKIVRFRGEPTPSDIVRLTQLESMGKIEIIRGVKPISPGISVRSPEIVGFRVKSAPSIKQVREAGLENVIAKTFRFDKKGRIFLRGERFAGQTETISERTILRRGRTVKGPAREFVLTDTKYQRLLQMARGKEARIKARPPRPLREDLFRFKVTGTDTAMEKRIVSQRGLPKEQGLGKVQKEVQRLFETPIEVRRAEAYQIRYTAPRGPAAKDVKILRPRKVIRVGVPEPGFEPEVTIPVKSGKATVLTKATPRGGYRLNAEALESRADERLFLVTETVPRRVVARPAFEPGGMGIVPAISPRSGSTESMRTEPVMKVQPSVRARGAERLVTRPGTRVQFRSRVAAFRRVQPSARIQPSLRAVPALRAEPALRVQPALRSLLRPQVQIRTQTRTQLTTAARQAPPPALIGPRSGNIDRKRKKRLDALARRFFGRRKRLIGGFADLASINISVARGGRATVPESPKRIREIERELREEGGVGLFPTKETAKFRKVRF